MATAASLFIAGFVASPAVPDASTPGVQAGVSGQPPTGDDIAPSVAIEGRRSVRAPDVARIQVVGADNEQIRTVEVLYSDAQIVDRAPRGVHVKRMALSLNFRRPGRYRLRVLASDANVNSGYKRATVIVAPPRAGTAR